MLVKVAVKGVWVRKEKKKKEGKKVITLKQEYRDQLKISGSPPDVLVESRDKIYPSAQKRRLSSCRDLTWACLQWNMLHPVFARGEEPAPRPLQPHGSSSPTAAAPAPHGSRAAEGRSVLHGRSLPPCSSKQKGSEVRGKVSRRRQIIPFC